MANLGKILLLNPPSTNIVMNYTEMESKVREATNDEAWGPTGQLMQELALATFSYEYFPEVMAMLWRRMLIDNQSNWRRTYKSLVVLNYLVKNGAERVVTSAREHIYDLKTLENYSFIDDAGKDCGINVRHRVKQLIEFIQDDDALREERKKAKKNRDKYVGVSSDGSATGSVGLKFDSISSSYRDSPLSAGPSKLSSKAFNEDRIGFGENNNNVNTNSDKSQPNSIDSSAGGQDESCDVETSVTVRKETVNKLKEAKKPSPVFDLLAELATEDSDITSEPKLVGLENNVVAKNDTSSKKNDEDLKAIIKNMDIFSNKRPKPQRLNRSDIPDLTLKNPNPVVGGNSKRSVQSVSNSTPISKTSNIQFDETKGLDSTLFAVDAADQPATSQTTTNPPKTNDLLSTPALSGQPPVDEFDLLSIGSVPYVNSSDTTSSLQLDITKPSSAINELSSLNLTANKDPFSFDQMPSDLLNPMAQVTSSEPSLNLNHSSFSNDLIDAAVQPAHSKSTKLPETWSSMISGTKFNIDLDNLLSPDMKKGVAPSLNQLAKNKPNDDDLFG